MPYVINHPEMGVYLGSCMGLGFWSRLDPVDDTAATFDTQEEACRWIDGRPKGAELIEVQAEPGQKATISACVAAGLDAWIFTYEHVPEII
jgi:hypothetical protein